MCCFFKQKASYEMRIRYWSSDVCSSDLAADAPRARVGSIPRRNGATRDRTSMPRSRSFPRPSSTASGATASTVGLRLTHAFGAWLLHTCGPSSRACAPTPRRVSSLLEAGRPRTSNSSEENMMNRFQNYLGDIAHMTDTSDLAKGSYVHPRLRNLGSVSLLLVDRKS